MTEVASFPLCGIISFTQRGRGEKLALLAFLLFLTSVLPSIQPSCEYGVFTPIGVLPTGFRSLAKRTQQNTSEHERLTHVAIVDPRHPLFGRTFVLLRDFSPRGNSTVTIQLSNGQRRVVPRSATNLNAKVRGKSTIADLPIISVRTILPVAQFVQAKLRASKEERNDCSSSCVGEAISCR